MDGKGWLVIGGGLAALWAWNNPDKAWRILDGLARWSEQEQQRQVLEAAPLPTLLPPPSQLPTVTLPPPQPQLQPPPALALPNFDFAKISAELKASSDGAIPGGAALQVQAYTPPVDEAVVRLVHHPAVVLIVGHRGSGKSALAVRLQELLRDVAPPYAIGLPAKASKLLPEWYGLAEDPGLIPQNAIVYIPESYRLFHSRSTQSAPGRAIAGLVNLSRHRRHTLIFDVQNASHLDRNIISEVDLVLVKQPGPFQQGFERSQLAPVMDAARAAFAGVPEAKRRRHVWAVSPNAGVEGRLMENELPSFWSERISTIFGDTVASLGRSGAAAEVHPGEKVGKSSAAARPRTGKKTTTESKRERAHKMAAAGYSQRKIAATIGISPSYVNKLLKGAR